MQDIHTVLDILLVGKDQQQRVPHLSVRYDPVQFLPRLIYAASVRRVHDEDQALSSCSSEEGQLACLPLYGTSLMSSSLFPSAATAPASTGSCLKGDRTPHTGEVMPPERSDLVLAADIPYVELDVLVHDRLDVEAHGRNGRDVLVQLELVHDSCSDSRGVVSMSSRRRR